MTPPLARRPLATMRLVGMVAAPVPTIARPVARSNVTTPTPAAASPGQKSGWGAGAGAERLLSTRQLRVTAIKP